MGLSDQNTNRLHQRNKQIALGLITPGYKNFTQSVAKRFRNAKALEQNINDIVEVDTLLERALPITPDPKSPYPKRTWDRWVSAWRRSLHTWDSPINLQNKPAAAHLLRAIKPNADELKELEQEIAEAWSMLKALRVEGIDKQEYSDSSDTASLDGLYAPEACERDIGSSTRSTSCENGSEDRNSIGSESDDDAKNLIFQPEKLLELDSSYEGTFFSQRKQDVPPMSPQSIGLYF